jgi:hypothetical protein
MAAATMYVTVAGAGDKSGGTWATAMDMAAFITDIEGAAEAGDIYYVAGGTYTMGEAIDMSTQDGTATSPITVIGVASGTSNEPPVVGDHATGDNRPLFAMEANQFKCAQYWKFYNIRWTGSENLGVYTDSFDVFFNCKSSHSGSTGFYMSASSQCIACEVTGSTNAFTTNGNCLIAFCYGHDVTTIINASSAAYTVVGTIIDAGTTGINVNTRDNGFFINNTIYDCDKGISASAGAKNIAVINNIIKCDVGGAQVGIDWTSQTWCNFIDFNCWDCDDEIQDTDVEKGFYAVTGDPTLADPGAGDFTADSGDNVHNAGLDAGQFTGATV